MNTGPAFRPKRRFAQHFLVKEKVIHKIIVRAGLDPSDVVLEIGPGQGALTLPLARRVERVIAVERDRTLIGPLEERLSRGGITNVTVINHDILAWDFRNLGFPSKRIRVMGNLPYNISSPVLEKLIHYRALFKKAVLMFQAEVAQRLTAAPGNKSYGALTLLVGFHARSAMLFQVPREAFYPRPKVDSMVVELDFESPYPSSSALQAPFKAVVKGAFSHRRKTLANALKNALPREDLETLHKAFEDCGIDPGRRAETLHMDQFMCLARALVLTKEGLKDND